MARLLENPRVQLTKIDRFTFDPGEGCFRGDLHDLDRFCKIYLGDDAQAFPWQCYFYHSPQRDKLAVAGIRTGKTHTIGYGFSHKGMGHRGMKLLNVSISSEQSKLAYYKVLEVFGHDRIKH